MKTICFAFALITFFSSRSFANEIELLSRVESVTVYHSGALVTRTSNTPLKTGINEIILNNVSSKIVLNSIKVNNKEVTVLNKSLIRKLSDEEFNQLLDKKQALQKQIELIESKYSEPGFIKEVEDLEKMTAFYAEKIVGLKKQMRATEERISEAKKLDNITIDNENAGILKMVLSIDGNLKGPLSLQYVCGGIGWSPSYDINVASSSDNTIEIKYLAKMMSQTGEDWDNVTISLSSSFPLEAPNQLPRADIVWTISKSDDLENPNIENYESAEYEKIDRLVGVEYQDIAISSFIKQFTLKEKYAVKSNSTVFTFPILTKSLPAEYFYYGFPSLDPEVYLVAQITAWDNLGFVDGVANISFAGNDIGKSVVKFSDARDTLLLAIGKDNSVYMKRSEIADKKYFTTTSIGKKKQATQAYQFELKNNNAFPIRFELYDQIPISQTRMVAVDVIKSSNANLNPSTGELFWEDDLKPGQSTVKELIFNIEMDQEFRYYSGGAKRKFRTIACPSF